MNYFLKNFKFLIKLHRFFFLNKLKTKIIDTRRPKRHTYLRDFLDFMRIILLRKPWVKIKICDYFIF